MVAKSGHIPPALDTCTPSPPSAGARRAGNPKPQSLDISSAQAVPSPALDLQHQLGEQLTGFSFQHDSEMAGPSDRWSTRRTLAFIVISNGVAWATIAWMVSSLVA